MRTIAAALGLALLLSAGASLAQPDAIGRLLDLYAAGRTVEFCSEVGSVLAAHSTDERYPKLLLLSAGCSDQALGRIARLREVCNAVPDAPEAAQAALQAAELSFLLGDYPTAAESAQLALDKAPDDATLALRSRRLLIDCQLAQGHPDLAGNMLRALLEAAPADAAGLEQDVLLLAGLELEAGRPEETLQLCQRLIPQGPIDLMPQTLLLAGQAHIKLGHPGAAARMLRVALLFNNSPQAAQADRLLRIELQPKLPDPALSGAGSFSALVGPFADEHSAQQALGLIRQMGFKAAPQQREGKRMLRVGPFEAEVDAFLALRRIERELGLHGSLVQGR